MDSLVESLEAIDHVGQNLRPRLLEAARFMDTNECNTVITAARSCSGLPTEEALEELDGGAAAFGKATRENFGKACEW